MRPLLLLIWLVSFFRASAQDDTTAVDAIQRTISLSEVVVRSDLNVNRFLHQIKNDSSFYKAFRNLRIVGFTSLNDIRLYNKKEKLTASLQSKTRQNRENGCRTMEVVQEQVTGDMYDKDHQWNYYTAQLYASLFFTSGKVCGETNRVGDMDRNVKEKKGLEKHKEQLKMLFFNPGKKIPGIPFIGNKLDVFDEEVAAYYDYAIDLSALNREPCYVFSITAKKGLSKGEKDHIVFDNITTWFDAKTLEVVARNYSLSYNAGFYDFDVHMEVEMTRFDGLLVPHILRYNGNWHVAFKKREHGIFTATLFDFTH